MVKNTSPSPATSRYYDIDWLRVFAMLVVFLFHAAKPFLQDPWHIKNPQVDPILEFVVGLFDVWMMPLLFIVSGMSVALSLRSRTARAFVQERGKRLLIPFLFGVVILSPIQVYIERLYYQQFDGSFLQFLPQAFAGLYLGYGGAGNFAWMGIHLWFLGVLLIYSCLLLPLFLALSRKEWEERLSRLGTMLERPGVLLLGSIPLMMLSTLNPSGLGRRDFGMWNLPIYLPLLLYGFLITRTLKEYSVLYRHRWLTLVVSLVAGLVAAPLDGATFGTTGFFVGQAARGLAMWGFVLLLLGLFYPLRQTNSRFLHYTSEMVLPFYILHQPIIVILGYFLVLPLGLPPLVKYLLLSMISLPIVVASYEFLVRRSNLLRYLHGLKPLSTVGTSAVEKERTELQA